MRACVLWILYLCVCCSGSKDDKIEQVPEESGAVEAPSGNNEDSESSSEVGKEPLDTYTWMGSLEDECLLSMLSIPGTHDIHKYVGSPPSQSCNRCMSWRIYHGRNYRVRG